MDYRKILAATVAVIGTVAMAADGIVSSSVVGYNQTAATEDTSILIGASFEAVGGGTFLPLSALTATPALENDDQIQVAYTDEDGLTQFTIYIYDETDGWLDTENFEPCGDTFGLELGQSAWFISAGEPKKITTAGAVKNSNAIRTFTEPSALITSAFPVPFCPNSENVSWGVQNDDQIQTAYTDEDGLTQFTIYIYDESDGWLDTENFEPLGATQSIVDTGIGFWLILQDASSTFTEVSPLAE